MKMLITVIVCILIFLVGCKQEEANNLDYIARSLFSEINEVLLIKGMGPNTVKLDSNQIEVLKNSIKNGNDVTTISNEEFTKTGYLDAYVFIIYKRNKRGTHLWYDDKNSYLYVEKLNVHYDKHKIMDMNIQKKYIEGNYRFHPAKSIEALIEK